MTSRAVDGAFFIVFMAVDTLAVGCICTRNNFGTFDFVRLMAIETTLRKGFLFGNLLMAVPTGDQGTFVIHGMVMAVCTGKTIAHFRCVVGMIEQDLACCSLIHDSIRRVRGFGGEGGVADNTHEKKNCGQTIDE
jgi:hypothetical protein